MSQIVRIGTRRSALAVAQTELAARMMRERTPGLQTELVLKQTTGDRILDKPLLEFGGKGVFVSEFEEALQRGEIDFAVHSAKDLPMELAEGLEIVGVPERGDVRDVLVARDGGGIQEKISRGEPVVIGTSSLRRQIQIEALGPEIWDGASVECRNLRGNVQTRLAKLREGLYDAVILAAAGLERLGLLGEESGGLADGWTAPEAGELAGLRVRYLGWEEMIPAGCQGILAVEGRAGDPANEAAERICDPDALLCFRLERRVLKLLEAGCHEPIGVCGRIRGGRMEARAVYRGADGQTRKAAWEGAAADWKAGAERIAAALKPGQKDGRSGGAGAGGGIVTLVGAGPGDAGLITARGLFALRACDCVVYDSLASEELLGETRPDCERIYVGKRAGRHSMRQEEINRLLVEQARLGRRVVRLKGGDPFVFGRGGEEILELQREGIPYEVIPGVTSAVAALAAAGIPITHRGMSRSFHVMTGHTKENGLPEDLEEFGRLSGTLVFLMGLGHLEEICKSLIRQGKPEDTPAAVIQSGTLPGQKAVRGTLKTICGACAAAGIGSPAVIAVGEVTALHMESTVRRPLEGVKVGVTGTPSFAGRLEAALREQGASVEKLCAMEVVSLRDSEPVRRCVEELGDYTWLALTSANGVRLFLEALLESGRDLRSLGHLKLAAVGSGTAGELERRGLRADFVPEEYSAKALGAGLAGILKSGDRVLMPRAVRGSKELNAALDAAGIAYTDVPLYDVRPAGLEREGLGERLAGLDYLTFASSSGVQGFFESLPEDAGELPAKIRIVSIGAATAAALERAGRKADLTAEEFSIPGIVDGICRDRKAGQ